jgi:hypothetical protein
MIVPAVATGAAGELTDLRGACAVAIDRLALAEADRLVVIGTGETTQRHGQAAVGTFAGFGVALDVDIAPAAGTARAQIRAQTRAQTGAQGAAVTAGLPLSLTVGVWLLACAGATAPEIVLQSVAADASPAGCAALGVELAAPGRVALLVMGDGSAAHGPGAAGYDDPRARPYDQHVSRALATADVDALLGLDPELSARLPAAGRAPWQVLAGAAQRAGGGWRAALHYDAAPYGVGYFVVTWERE